MKAVVLVGGEGTRLRPLTYDIPKPMVPICGKYFTRYQLDLIKMHGINDVIFSLGYKWDSFENHFGDGSSLGMKIHYVVEDHPLGTAGAIKNVEDYLDEDPFLVFNGDILSEMNLTDILKFHNDKNADCTIVLTPVDNPTIYGVVELDENMQIHKFTEKPKPEEVRSNLINAGLYVLKRKMFDRMEKDKKYSIEREIFPAMLRDEESMFGYDYRGYWMDIGTPYKYLKANHDMVMGKMQFDVGMKDGFHLGAGSTVGKNVTIEKPVWIGDNVEIADDVTITGPAVIQQGSILGQGAEIDGALLWDGVTVGSGAQLKGCLAGRNAKIGSKAKLGSLAVVGSNEEVEEGSVVEPETKIYSGVKNAV